MNHVFWVGAREAESGLWEMIRSLGLQRQTAHAYRLLLEAEFPSSENPPEMMFSSP